MVAGATVSGGWRRMPSTAAASKRRMRWLLRMRPIALLMARAAAFRRRHRVPQIEEPVAGEVFAQRMHLRIIAPQLVAHAVGEAVLLLLEFVVHEAPFAQR